jgi:hypothetical protein
VAAVRMGGDGEAATQVGEDAVAWLGGVRWRGWGGAATRMRYAARRSSFPPRTQGGGLGIAQLACIFGIIFLGELVANSPKIAHLFGCYLSYLG